MFSAAPPAVRSSDGRKVIRDAIWGFHELDAAAFQLLDAPFLQRLRHLSQTALAFHTYPCATHSRFEHSLGAYTLAGRMLDALEANSRHKFGLDEPISEHDRTAVRIAALLHDIGHGPFSHASEEVYGANDLFDKARAEQPRRFGDASASEMLAWFLLQTKPVRELWDQVLGESGVTTREVGALIVGSDDELSDTLRPLRKVVNGTFDADKLDYLTRDSHYTGLHVGLDVPRLLQGVLLARLPGTSSPEFVVDYGSLAAVEQVLFAKSQLYTQMYHHQKVRAGVQLVRRLVEETWGREVAGVKVDGPWAFLGLDECDLLARPPTPTAETLAARIKHRRLPRRALALSDPCIPPGVSTINRLHWNELRTTLMRFPKARREAETRIAALMDVPAESVMFDVPTPAKFLATGTAIMRMPGNEYRPLAQVFPAQGWANAHDVYLTVSYVFTDVEDPQRAAEAAERWLRELPRPVKVNDLAFRLAKTRPPAQASAIHAG